MGSLILEQHLKDLIAKDTHIELMERMIEFIHQRYYYELGEVLESITRSDELANDIDFLELYRKAYGIMKVNLDQIMHCKIAFNIIKHCEDLEGALEVFTKTKDNFEPNTLEILSMKIAIVLIYLRSNNLREAKGALIEIGPQLKNFRKLNIAHKMYYHVKMIYYLNLKNKANHTKYFKNALKYLGCENLNDLTSVEKAKFAYDCSIACLISRHVYEFSEFLEHDVIKNIENTQAEPYVKLIRCITEYDIQGFNKMRHIIQTHNKETLIIEKMKIVGLWELCSDSNIHFGNPIPFEMISKELEIPMQDVEKLLMSAFTHCYIKGRIDEYNQQVYITFMTPKLLSNRQISNLSEKFVDWEKYLDMSWKLSVME